MGKYFFLQLKRILKHLPGVLFVCAVLLIALLAVFMLFTQQEKNAQDNQKFPIAICGETNDTFLQMGLSTLKSFDSSRFALEIVEMEEDAAAVALARGELSAYAVIPEDFIAEAFSGNILPIRFVTANGAKGMVSLVKEELCNMVSAILLNSQKGVYGMYDALIDNDLYEKADGQMDLLALKYVDYIFVRDHIYRLEELGIADSLSLYEYVICGLGVLFSLLICLPFAPRMIPGDPALGRMLHAKGHFAVKQGLCDLGAYLLAQIILLFILLGAVFLYEPKLSNIGRLFMQCLPVIIMTSSLSFMLYSVSRDLVGGIMLQFFVSLILCFVSGCLYPVFFFPVQLQQIAHWLPTGLAQTYLSGFITMDASFGVLLALILYSIVFSGVGVYARVRHIKEVVL